MNYLYAIPVMTFIAILVERRVSRSSRRPVVPRPTYRPAEERGPAWRSLFRR